MDYSDSRMLIYAVFLLSIAIGTTGGALVYGPTDQNVTVGQQVILLCATDLDLPVYWYFKGNEIFYGGKVAMSFQDRYNIFSNKTGEYNLVIPSADVSYNGEYICGDDEGEGQRKSALLYVTAETVTVAETKGSTSNDGVNLGLIIGIVVGIVLCIAILIITVYCCKKSANKKEKKSPDNAEAGEKLLDKGSGAAKVVIIKSDRTPTPKDSGAKEVTANRNIEETPNLKDSGAKEVTANSNIEETPNLKDSGAKEAAKSNIYGTPHRTDPAPAAGNKGAPKLNEGSGAAKAVTIKTDRTPTPKDSAAKETANSNVEQPHNLTADEGKKFFNKGCDFESKTKSGPQNAEAIKGRQTVSPSQRKPDPKEFFTPPNLAPIGRFVEPCNQDGNVTNKDSVTVSSDTGSLVGGRYQTVDLPNAAQLTGSITADGNPFMDPIVDNSYSGAAEKNASNAAPSSGATTEHSEVGGREIGSPGVDTKQNASSTIPTNGFKAGENEPNTSLNDSKGADKNPKAESSETGSPGGGTEENTPRPTTTMSNPRVKYHKTASSKEKEDKPNHPRENFLFR